MAGCCPCEEVMRQEGLFHFNKPEESFSQGGVSIQPKKPTLIRWSDEPTSMPCGLHCTPIDYIFAFTGLAPAIHIPTGLSVQSSPNIIMKSIIRGLALVLFYQLNKTAIAPGTWPCLWVWLQFLFQQENLIKLHCYLSRN